MNTVRQASRSEEVLMKDVGSALESKLHSLGQAAVREIVTQANRLSVDPDHLPYVFWALATQAGLPSLGKDQKLFDLTMMVMSRSGAMPNYQSSFSVVDDFATDSAVNTLAKHMGKWARQTMIPGLLRGYQEALTSQVKNVPRATNNTVKKKDAFEFLRRAFPQVLTMRSRMFNNGEMLRRVVRVLPI